jgi:PTS system nitrogen regulatory IIA component
MIGSNMVLTLEQAARHIRIEPHELLHLAQRDEIPYRKRGDEYFFEHRAVDEWAQRNILSLEPKRLIVRHQQIIADQHKRVKDDRVIGALMRPEWIDAEMPSRTRPGVIRDMVALALKTGLLYDDVLLQQAVEEREAAASTAVAEGAAFLHARYHDPYTSSDSFIVLGRAVHPVFFGEADGKPTDLFFLICCVDDVLHLHVLARLCLLIHGTELAQQLRDAASPEEMYQLLVNAEEQFLGGIQG